MNSLLQFNDNFNGLIYSSYKISSSFLEWIAADIHNYVGIPRLSILMGALWLIALIVWLAERTLQPCEESAVKGLFNLFWKLIVVVIGLFIMGVILAVWVAFNYRSFSNSIFEWVKQFLITPFIMTILILVVFNLIVGWFAVRHWLPKLNHWVNKTITKKGYQESGISDIRQISNLSPKSVDYDPQDYWKLNSGQIFIGLDLEMQPVYFPVSEWRTLHQQLVGTSGFGKTLSVSNQLSQCLAMNQVVVVFDPKNDEWAPSVLLSVAEQYNRTVCIIDLNDEGLQFNPLYGANQKQLFDLFVGSFGLAEGRGDSDYYRTLERRVVRQWIQGLAKGQSLIQLADGLTEADFKNAPKLCNDLSELAMLGCINTRQKGAWYDVIDEGGLVYIIGTVRNEPVLRLQKMLLLRMMQRLEQRDRNQSHIHVTIFLDELKYLLCKPSLQALGTIRDKFANVILAHQSIDDLRDVPADLDPQAVKSAVLENTALKLIYRSQDPDTIEWTAKRSGTIPAHKEMLEQSRNEGFSEITRGERRLIETERYLIDENTILTLQKRCGIWFSTELAKIVLTSPIKTEKRTITPTLVAQNEEPTHGLEKENDSELEMFS